MPSITINERDLTTGGDQISNYNIVYVPGFMDTSDGAFTFNNEVDKSHMAQKNVPTLCRSVREFEQAFGTKPLYFEGTVEEGAPKFDLSYLYAKELLSLGLPVLYESMNDGNDQKDASVDAMYLALSGDNGPYTRLEDKGIYQFKYITSGGYPNYKKGDTNVNIYSKLTDLAVDRGDCIALIDHDKSYTEVDTLHSEIKTELASMDGAEYATMFTPWVNINTSTYKPLRGEDKKIITGETTIHLMPPSFGYLSALAKSIRTNPSWLAVAGAIRGQIPNLNGENPLNVTKIITNSIAEDVQPRKDIAINPVTEIKPFGYRIWGNRTLKNNAIEGDLTATSFLNTRNMICDVKKVIYEACRKYVFEQNNDLLWINFKSYIEPTLNQMKAGAGLSGYKIIKETTNQKAKLVAKVKLYPLYAVEDFDIEVQMLDEEIKVS